MFGNGGADAGKLARSPPRAARGRTSTRPSTPHSASRTRSSTSDLRRYLERGRLRLRRGRAPRSKRRDDDRARLGSQRRVRARPSRPRSAEPRSSLAPRRSRDRLGAALAGRLRAQSLCRPRDPATRNRSCSALERAAELGSRESWIYATQADRLLMESRTRPRPSRRVVAGGDGARAADLYERARRPPRSRTRAAFAGLVMALLNVAVR